MARKRKNNLAKNSLKNSLLKKEEQLNTLTSITDNVKDALFSKDKDRKYTFVNPAAEKLIGLPASKIIGKTPENVFTCKNARIIRQVDNLNFKGKIVDTVRVLDLGGKLRSLHVIQVPIKDGEGHVIGITGVVREVTEEQEIKKELKDSEEKYRSLIENSHDLIQSVNLDGSFRFVNKCWMDVLGYSEQEIKKMKVWEIIDKSQLKHCKKIFVNLMKGNVAKNIQTKFVKKNGAIIDVIGNIGVLHEDHKVFATQGFFHDITDQKKSEEELRASEERYRTFFDNSKDALMTLEPPNWNFTSGNESIIKMFGVRDEKEFTSLRPWDISPKYQPDGQLSVVKAKKMIGKALKDGFNYFEWTHKKVRGDDFYATVLLNRLNIQGKQILQATVRDITERKIAREKLLLIQKAVDSSTEAIGMSDPAGRHFYQNKAFSDLFGYKTAEELQKKGGGPALYMDKKISKEVFKTIMNGKSWSGEIEMKSKNGRIFTVDLRADAIKDEKNNIIGLIGIHTDITEKKEVVNILSESELRYRRLFESSQDGVLIVDALTGRIIDANQSVQKIFGYSLKKLIGKDLWVLGLLDSILPGREKFRKLLKQDHLHFANIIAKTKGKRTVIIEFISNLYFINEKEVIQFNIRNITKRFNAEKRVKESEQKYHDLVERANDGVVIIQDGLIKYVNSWSEKVMGYKPRQLINKPFLKYVDKSERAIVKERYIQRMKGKNVPEVYESTLLSSQKKPVSVEINAGLTIFEGKPANQVVIRDITERKKNIEKIKESEERYRIVAEKTGSIVYDYNLLTGEISWFGAIEEVVGYQNEEFQKVNIKEWEKMIHPDDKKAALDYLAMAEKEVGTYNVIYRFRNKKGDYIWIEDNGVFIPDKYGKPVRMYGVMKNISERKKVVELLQDAYKELKKVDELKSKAIRDVSHEFKTPISKINMTTHLLQEEITKPHFDKEKVSTYLGILSNSSTTFLEQLNAVFALSKIQSVSSLMKKKVNVHELIEKLIKDKTLVKKGVSLRFESRRIPKISANKEMIETMVRNLLNNAFKFTDKGYILVTCKKKGHNLYISVKDTGKGMSKEGLNKLFKPFTQLDPSVPGLGIGLASVKKIVDLHQGSIKVQSTLGKGTKFVVLLPINNK